MVFALSAGLALVPVAGLPASAGAAPAPPAVVTGPPEQPGDLQSRLITEKDVPKGYVARDLPEADQMFASMLTGYRLNADPCAPLPTGTDAGGSQRPSADPVKVKQITPGESTGDSATALFLNEKKGVVAVEMLAVTGEDVAVDMVGDTETVIDECPVVETEESRLETVALDWNPPLGDESITVGLRFEIKKPKLAIVGKLAFVAYRDLSLTVGLIGVKEPSDRDLKKVVRAAIRKIVLTSEISSKVRT